MAPAPASAPAYAVDWAATTAAGEEAAPGRHTGGPTAGRRTGSEVRDGSLPGTVKDKKGKCCETDKYEENWSYNVYILLNIKAALINIFI